MNLASQHRYYDAQGLLNRGFLHPGGRTATARLLSFLPDLSVERRILEIGCGVGTTAAQVSESNLATYIGIDNSPIMLARTSKCLSHRRRGVVLLQADLANGPIPLASGTVDAIIAESVMGILPWMPLASECARVLAPGGLLLCNDRIWGGRMTQEERHELAEASWQRFGFFPAPQEFTTAGEWKKLLAYAGLEVIHSEEIPRERAAWGEGSGHLSIRGLVRLCIRHPEAVIPVIQDRSIAFRYAALWKKMEYWIVIARRVMPR